MSYYLDWIFDYGYRQCNFTMSSFEFTVCAVLQFLRVTVSGVMYVYRIKDQVLSEEQLLAAHPPALVPIIDYMNIRFVASDFDYKLASVTIKWDTTKNRFRSCVFYLESRLVSLQLLPRSHWCLSSKWLHSCCQPRSWLVSDCSYFVSSCSDSLFTCMGMRSTVGLDNF